MKKYNLDTIDWFETKHGLGIEIILDITLSWVWKITPLHPKATYQKQIISKNVHMKRKLAINEAITKAFELIT